MLDELEANDQIVLRYRAGQNFNGSSRDIAGVSNKAGNVVGLMPHPEHAVDVLTGSADGLKLFESAAQVHEAIAPPPLPVIRPEPWSTGSWASPTTSTT